MTSSNRLSRVDQLPSEIKDALDRLLRDGRHSQLEILAHINKLLPDDEEPISKSSLNRYAVRMSAVGSKLRETREIANVWMARFGDEPGSDVLQLLVEMCQGALFKHLLTSSESDDEELFDPEAMKDITLSIQRLTKSAELNLKREKELHRAFAEKAAAEADVVGKEQGLSAEGVQAIKNRILGIAQ